MSIEFRLKYLREAIDKNINEILLKWNARKVLLSESFDEDSKDSCPSCMEAGKQSFLKYSYVNMDEAVYKCESAACLYPFRNFKYKNYVDRTIFRYERIVEKNENNSEQKLFASPTKIENDDMDHFNLNWLDNSFTDDLDSILTTPTEGTTCDIKEIINNICNNVEATPTTYNTPSRIGSEQPSNTPTPKLSKCLQYIEQLSPSKLSSSNKVETMTSKTRIAQDCSSRQSAANNKVVKSKSSLKRIRSGFQKNQEINPIRPAIVEQEEQQSLGFRDWLDVVSKIEPKQMQEFEFVSPTQIKDSCENQLSNNTEKSTDSNTQPVLIELMGTSYALDGNELPNISAPCLLYQLDCNESNLDTTTNVNSENSNTTQSLDNILSVEQSLVNPVATDVERSSFVAEESVSTDFHIIKTKHKAGNKRSKQNHIVNNGVKRAKLVNSEKIAAKQKKKEENEKRRMENRQTKQEERKKRKLMEQKKVNRKKFNIEMEENFYGFETVEPFIPIKLRSKSLEWLQNE